MGQWPGDGAISGEAQTFRPCDLSTWAGDEVRQNSEAPVDDSDAEFFYKEVAGHGMVVTVSA